jgi:ATP-dependent Clp protease ATP-binding subunit ClpB
MTSNLGSDRIQENFGMVSYDEMKQSVMDVVMQNFRPEFLNRVDESVVFHPLDANNIKHIASIQIELLRKRLAEKDFDLLVSEQALSLIAEAGFDPVYGARPLKRALQQEVENPLAQKLLRGQLIPGQAIRVDVEEGQLVFLQ